MDIVSLPACYQPSSYGAKILLTASYFSKQGAGHCWQRIAVLRTSLAAHHQLHVLLPELYQLHVLFVESCLEPDDLQQQHKQHTQEVLHFIGLMAHGNPLLHQHGQLHAGTVTIAQLKPAEQMLADNASIVSKLQLELQTTCCRCCCACVL
jgi:hypothetical protein